MQRNRVPRRELVDSNAGNAPSEQNSSRDLGDVSLRTNGNVGGGTKGGRIVGKHSKGTANVVWTVPRVYACSCSCSCSNVNEGNAVEHLSHIPSEIEASETVGADGWTTHWSATTEPMTIPSHIPSAWTTERSPPHLVSGETQQSQRIHCAWGRVSYGERRRCRRGR